MQRWWVVALALAAFALALLPLLWTSLFGSLGALAAFPAVAVAIAAIAVAFHAHRRRVGKETLPPPRSRPAPVPVPEPEQLDRLDWPFTACPDCGYLGVRAPGIRDALWPGGGETGARFVCGRCHYQGIPIEFETSDDYVEFVRGLHATSMTHLT